MKTLAVLRHAKSSWDNPSLADFDRPLNARGRKAAKAVGKEIKPRIRSFDLVLSSPAIRARETLERFEASYGTLPPARFEPDIYMASPQTLLRMLRLLGDKEETVLLVGHNPGLQELVLELTAPNDSLREHVDKFPTGAVALLEIPISHWRDVKCGTAEILDLIFPRNLRV